MPDKVELKPATPDISCNLVGQKLGRKGLETRERILRAALSLLDKPQPDPSITLSAIAREASVGMTTLYLYFPDLGDLVLAALQRVMATADNAYLDRLRQRWADDAIEENCLDFLRAHFQFWREHSRILHLRNSFADGGDIRFIDYRGRVTSPLMRFLASQMNGDPAATEGPALDFAVVMVTGFERLATVITADNYYMIGDQGDNSDRQEQIERLLCTEARMIALTVRDRRGGPV